jgi:hypothetical protein
MTLSIVRLSISRAFGYRCCRYRLAALGPEMRKLADERLQQINLAFDAAERRYTGQ